MPAVTETASTTTPVLSKDISLSASFAEWGVIGPIDVISPEKAKVALNEVDDELSTANAMDDPKSRFKLHLFVPSIASIAYHPTIIQVVQDILQTKNVLLWSSDVNRKPAQSGGFFAPHQDATYAGLEPAEKCVTVWVALSDPVGEQEGCLSFYRSSHKHGQVPHATKYRDGANESSEQRQGFITYNGNSNSNMLSLGQYVADQHLLDQSTRITIPLRAGQATVHQFYTIHESGPNRRSYPRVGLALRYMAGTVRQTKPTREMATLISSTSVAHNFDIEPRLPETGVTERHIQRGRTARDEAMKREADNYFL